MAFQEALKKQLIGNNYLSMTPHSIRKGMLFTEGPSLVPLRLAGVFVIEFNWNGM